MKRAALWVAFLILVVVGLVKCFPGPSPAAANFRPATQTLEVYSTTSCRGCILDKPVVKQLEESGEYEVIYVENADQFGVPLPFYRVFENGRLILQTHNVSDL